MVISHFLKTMRSRLFSICIVLVSICLIGCHTNDADVTKKEGTNAIDQGGGEVKSEKDIYDFYFINRAPEATEKHALEKLIKIYFSHGNIAVDIGKNELYEIPRFATNGITTFEEPLEFHDKDGLLTILKKYDIQSWKKDYTTEEADSYEDGFGWMMLLQFEDGTIERYKGSGSFKEDVIPENFDAFTDELERFINEEIKEQSVDDAKFQV